MTQGTGQDSYLNGGHWPGITNLNKRDLYYAAMAYAHVGMKVFPVCAPLFVDGNLVGCTCQADKNCRKDNDGECPSPGKCPFIPYTKDATDDRNIVAALWKKFTFNFEGNYVEPNIGVLLGNQLNLWDGVSDVNDMSKRFGSSLIVVDLDIREIDGLFASGESLFFDFCAQLGMGGENVPETLVQQTGSGGMQLIFRDPSTDSNRVKQAIGWLRQKDSAGRDVPLVDIKAWNNMAVIAPSLHRSGKRYELLNDFIPQIPGPLLSGELMKAKGIGFSSHNRTITNGERPSFESIGMGQVPINELRIKGSALGFRDDNFTRLAFYCRKHGISEQEALAEVDRVYHLSDTSDKKFSLAAARAKVVRVYASQDTECLPESGATGTLPELDHEMVEWTDYARDAIAGGFTANGNSNGISASIQQDNQQSIADAAAQYLESQQYQVEPVPGKIGDETFNIPTTNPEQIEPDVAYDPPPRELDGLGHPHIRAESTDHTGNARRFIRLFKDETDGGCPDAGTKGIIVRRIGKNYNRVWNGVEWKLQPDTHLLYLMNHVSDDIKAQVLSYPDSEAHLSSGEGNKTVKDAMKDWMKKSEFTGTKKSSLELALIDPRLSADASDFNKDEYFHLVNCLNGIVDTKTGQLLPHDPKYMLTKTAQVEYKPEAAERGYAPQLDELFDMVIPNVVYGDETKSDYQVFETLLGHCILGANPDKTFVVVVGPSNCGKTTIFSTLQNALGLDSKGGLAAIGEVSIFRGAENDKANPKLLAVSDSTILTIEESNERLTLHGDQIKKITGGMEMQARYMASDKYHYSIPRFTPVLIINPDDIPHISGADTGVMNRLFVFTIHNPIPEYKIKDDGMKEIKNDMRCKESIFARAVRGAYMYHRTKLKTDPNLPKSYKVAKNKIFGSLDHVFIFWEDILESGKIKPLDMYKYDYSSCITSQQLYDEYSYWYDTHVRGSGERKVNSAKSLGQKLRTMPDYKFETVRSNGTRWVGWGHSATLSVSPYVPNN